MDVGVMDKWDNVPEMLRVPMQLREQSDLVSIEC